MSSFSDRRFPLIEKRFERQRDGVKPFTEQFFIENVQVQNVGKRGMDSPIYMKRIYTRSIIFTPQRSKEEPTQLPPSPPTAMSLTWERSYFENI